VQVFEVGDPDRVGELSMEIVQKPHFYRTWWFMAGMSLLIAAAVFGAYRYRIRQVRSKFEAVLEERNRLAREMHDTVIQGCTGASALIEALSMEGAVNRAEILEFAGNQLRSTINEAREAIWNLRESESEVAGIDEKIRGITAHLSREFNTPVHFNVSGTPFALSHPRAHDLLMVAREAVFNSVRHGSPTHVNVSLNYGADDLALRVSDDGCGFDNDPKSARQRHHFGLRGMKERLERSGGSFQLRTAPGQGVLIESHLPRKNRL
jgi:signal transduction histidine kinase